MPHQVFGSVTGLGEAEEGKGRGGFTYLDDDEAGAAVVGALVVYCGLVVGDVEALDCGTFLEVGSG